MPSSNPLLFERSSQPFDQSLWSNPTAEYRGAPFWSWNTKLTKDKLIRQLDCLSEMGMGGAHMHPRTGLDTAYLSDEYFSMVRACVDHCKEKGMLACLYDEDRWPSGAAGGLVSKANPDYRVQHILFTPWQYGKSPNPPARIGLSKAVAERSEDGNLLARYDVDVDQDGLASFRRLETSEQAKAREWFCYAEYQPPSTWWNGGTYVDTLSKEALALFIKMTHERYYEHFNDEFGKVIPSIFTDEPQFAKKEYLLDSHAVKDLFLPWTHDLPQTFEESYGINLLDHLPELFWDISDEPSLTRYHYHDHVCDRFVEAFLDQMSDWARTHGIALTGHLMQEPRLITQTESLGEAMRGYRNMDVPGIDMLCDAREYNTAKQCSSVARQNGVKGVMSEVYGVTNWTFDFKGHKASGDWQAALGVTFRVHHLAPVSLLGESKRDYPAAIGYQSPWYKEYRFIEDHFSRLNVALTRGKPITRVAVIHPIESFWLTYGPADRNGAVQAWRDKAYKDLTDWLLLSLIDFDFISESLFPDQTQLDDITTVLPVGKAKYDVVILPNLRTMRSTTLIRLQRFESNGGKIIATGGMPTLLDARPTEITLTAREIPFTQFDIVSALNEYREVRVIRHGVDTRSLLYQLRDDGDQRFLFICDIDRDDPIDTVVKIKGAFEVHVLDTLAGTEWEVKSSILQGWTAFNWTFWSCGHILARLVPIRESSGHDQDGCQLQPAYETGFNQVQQVKLDHITLSEPNVLLLDQASWKLAADPDWQPQVEVLRIDNLVRGRLGLPLKDITLSQPWTRTPKERKTISTLHLRFGFETAVDLHSLALAVEKVEDCQIRLDGKAISGQRVGWFVDEDISIIELGDVRAGKHVLEIEMPFGLLANVERVYVLGSFSVQLYGERAILQTLDLGLIRFGDYTRQGLPFYAGNVTYHCTFELSSSQHVVLQTYQFAGPAVTAIVNGARKFNLSLPPHLADLGPVDAGPQKVDFTCFGNRENAFGAIHMPRGETNYWGPNAWRGDQNYWQDEYDIKPMGITICPVVRVESPRKYIVTVRRRHDAH